jgi:hypothetical protein
MKRKGAVDFFLIVNALQGLVLFFMNAIGCMHWASDQCINYVNLILWTNFLALSCGTTLFFCAKLAGVIDRKTEKERYRRTTVTGLLVSSLDVLQMTLLSLFMTSPLVQTLTFKILPIVLVALNLYCMGLLYLRARAVFLFILRNTLLSSSDGSAKQSDSDRHIILTAQRYTYWSKFLLVSSALLTFSMAMIVTRLYTMHTHFFVLHVLTIDLAKICCLYSLSSVFQPVRLSTGWRASIVVPTAIKSVVGSSQVVSSITEGG